MKSITSTPAIVKPVVSTLMRTVTLCVLSYGVLAVVCLGWGQYAEMSFNGVKGRREMFVNAGH